MNGWVQVQSWAHAHEPERCGMPLSPLWNVECLTWRIPLFTNNSDLGEDPGFAPPEMDPHGDVTVRGIGELCENATNDAAT
ncbi:hypothetical protein [Rhodococcus qingshengii]|uniref:hypothetical protein n=1 Tax=Rhodococcus qingshengii TaxID=334542 RepID=UPI001F1D09F8|nr:hypothetical protein [Rhodococcus qingshengii]